MDLMNTSQPETNHASKRRGYRFWLGCFALLLGIPLLFYYGYCWGLWGRSSLLLQYFFQCSCPAASEEARYPDEMDVIVPACQHANSRLSPSGGLLYVRETESRPTSTYLLNLQTYEKIPFTLPESAFYFLTDDLLYVIPHYGGNEYILNRITEEQYPIQEFTSLYSNAYINGNFNLGLLAEALRAAKDVFLISNNIVVALAPDFPASSKHNFLVNRFDIPGRGSDRVEQFLQEYDIVYQTVSVSFPEEVVSQDGRFVARADGIYLVETGQKVVEGYSASRSYRAYSRKYFMVRGWTHDSTSVIYSKFLNPCLIETSGFFLDSPVCFYEVPQPVLKLKVPEKYLSPAKIS